MVRQASKSTVIAFQNIVVFLISSSKMFIKLSHRFDWFVKKLRPLLTRKIFLNHHDFIDGIFQKVIVHTVHYDASIIITIGFCRYY